MADMFLKLTSDEAGKEIVVEGESLDEVHPDEIEIHDWTWKVANSAPFKIHDVADATKFGSFDHITIHKIVDKASTTLMNYCAYGQHIKKGIITCRKNDGDTKFEYLKIELTDIKVEEVSWAEGRGQSNVHTEHVQLSFFSVKVIYKTQVVPPAPPKPGERPHPVQVSGPKDFHFDTQDKAQPAKPTK
jgi:type VI secretion system secreted protein Hcp